LLKAISSEGSINKGARKLGMAYKQAWDEINLMEKRFGMKLLRRRKGGVRGGGAELTEHALSLLGRYERFRDKATVAINAAFRDVFE
jgi:molybdate transport system regulatory protein